MNQLRATAAQQLLGALRESQALSVCLTTSLHNVEACKQLAELLESVIVLLEQLFARYQSSLFLQGLNSHLQSSAQLLLFGLLKVARLVGNYCTYTDPDHGHAHRPSSKSSCIVGSNTPSSAILHSAAISAAANIQLAVTVLATAVHYLEATQTLQQAEAAAVHHMTSSNITELLLDSAATNHITAGHSAASQYTAGFTPAGQFAAAGGALPAGQTVAGLAEPAFSTPAAAGTGCASKQQSQIHCPTPEAGPFCIQHDDRGPPNSNPAGPELLETADLCKETTPTLTSREVQECSSLLAEYGKFCSSQNRRSAGGQKQLQHAEGISAAATLGTQAGLAVCASANNLSKSAHHDHLIAEVKHPEATQASSRDIPTSPFAVCPANIQPTTQRPGKPWQQQQQQKSAYDAARLQALRELLVPGSTWAAAEDGANFKIMSSSTVAAAAAVSAVALMGQKAVQQQDEGIQQEKMLQTEAIASSAGTEAPHQHVSQKEGTTLAAVACESVDDSCKPATAAATASSTAAAAATSLESPDASSTDKDKGTEDPGHGCSAGVVIAAHCRQQQKDWQHNPEVAVTAVVTDAPNSSTAIWLQQQLQRVYNNPLLQGPKQQQQRHALLRRSLEISSGTAPPTNLQGFAVDTTAAHAPPMSITENTQQQQQQQQQQGRRRSASGSGPTWSSTSKTRLSNPGSIKSCLDSRTSGVPSCPCNVRHSASASIWGQPLCASAGSRQAAAAAGPDGYIRPNSEPGSSNGAAAGMIGFRRRGSGPEELRVSTEQMIKDLLGKDTAAAAAAVNGSSMTGRLDTGNSSLGGSIRDSICSANGYAAAAAAAKRGSSSSSSSVVWRRGSRNGPCLSDSGSLQEQNRSSSRSSSRGKSRGALVTSVAGASVVHLLAEATAAAAAASGTGGAYSAPITAASSGARSSLEATVQQQLQSSPRSSAAGASDVAAGGTTDDSGHGSSKVGGHCVADSGKCDGGCSHRCSSTSSTASQEMQSRSHNVCSTRNDDKQQCTSSGDGGCGDAACSMSHGITGSRNYGGSSMTGGGSRVPGGGSSMTGGGSRVPGGGSSMTGGGSSMTDGGSNSRSYLDRYNNRISSSRPCSAGGENNTAAGSTNIKEPPQAATAARRKQFTAAVDSSVGAAAANLSPAEDEMVRPKAVQECFCVAFKASTKSSRVQVCEDGHGQLVAAAMVVSGAAATASSIAASETQQDGSSSSTMCTARCSSSSGGGSSSSTEVSRLSSCGAAEGAGERCSFDIDALMQQQQQRWQQQQQQDVDKDVGRQQQQQEQEQWEEQQQAWQRCHQELRSLDGVDGLDIMPHLITTTAASSSEQQQQQQGQDNCISFLETGSDSRLQAAAAVVWDPEGRPCSTSSAASSSEASLDSSHASLVGASEHLDEHVHSDETEETNWSSNSDTMTSAAAVPAAAAAAAAAAAVAAAAAAAAAAAGQESVLKSQMPPTAISADVDKGFHTVAENNVFSTEIEAAEEDNYRAHQNVRSSLMIISSNGAAAAAAETLQAAARSLLAAGNAAYTNGSYTAAAKLYRAAMDKLEDKCQSNSCNNCYNSDDMLGMKCSLNLACCHLRLGQYRQCLAECDAILDVDPFNVVALCHRGRALLMLQQSQAAAHDLVKAQELLAADGAVQQQQQEGLLAAAGGLGGGKMYVRPMSPSMLVKVRLNNKYWQQRVAELLRQVALGASGTLISRSRLPLIIDVVSMTYSVTFAIQDESRAIIIS